MEELLHVQGTDVLLGKPFHRCHHPGDGIDDIRLRLRQQGGGAGDACLGVLRQRTQTQGECVGNLRRGGQLSR
ncbi:hypothetical protein D3C79_651660 [compost metagenome]